MSASDRFIGDWLVSEYVFAPDGQALGVVRQRRTLQPLPGGRIRVVQQCEPSPTLDGHAMAAFAGEWVFELQIEGRLRHYLGPDVIGYGKVWDNGYLEGCGCWPRFGKLFRSFSLLVTPERQLTGGRFFVGPAPIACITGVAAPANTQHDWPELAVAPPETIAHTWQGQMRHLSPTGEDIATELLMRRYCLPYIVETASTGDTKLRFDNQINTVQISGDGHGFAWRIGALTEGEVFTTSAQCIRFLEVCDSATATITGWRHHYHAGRLEKIETFQLHAQV